MSVLLVVGESPAIFAGPGPRSNIGRVPCFARPQFISLVREVNSPHLQFIPAMRKSDDLILMNKGVSHEQKTSRIGERPRPGESDSRTAGLDPARRRHYPRMLDPEWVGRVRRALVAWYEGAGIGKLPWREDRDPYRILVSEMMLVQTTVTAVDPLFRPLPGVDSRPCRGPGRGR